MAEKPGEWLKMVYDYFILPITAQPQSGSLPCFFSLAMVWGRPGFCLDRGRVCLKGNPQTGCPDAGEEKRPKWAQNTTKLTSALD